MVNRHDLASLSADERARLLTRVQQARSEDVERVVADVIEVVRERGDTALAEYTARFDGVDLEPRALRVPDEDIEAAGQRIDDDLKHAITTAIENIRAHHSAQVPSAQWFKEIRPGVISGERWTPIASVGLYVPRGKGSFPSVMAMLGMPAAIAGVPEVAVCTPPGPDGTVDAASLFVAKLCGIRTIYRVGGAQAIAALAFGTETVPRASKVVGPGNQYVTAAKRLLYGQIDPGPPAGPSESIVLCDGSADAGVAARELLVEAEHGPDSAALLVTDAPELADAVERLLPSLLEQLPEWRRRFCEQVLAGYGGIVVAPSADAAVEFVNDYAPEHLHVLTHDPFSTLNRIRHAGEVLLGPSTSIAMGNYCIGVNAILPTGGFARSYSCVGVADFMKRSSFAYVGDAGVEELGRAAARLAEYEGFPAHAAAAVHALGARPRRLA
jgi:histidinol dehydrogenase